MCALEGRVVRGCCQPGPGNPGYTARDRQGRPDRGIRLRRGGLTVARAIVDQLPRERVHQFTATGDLVFFAPLARRFLGPSVAANAANGG
jgi:hypothetical protein